MSEHDCKHETMLAIMQQDCADNKVICKEILKVLKGDNGYGLTTKVALNRSSIIRQWWFIGAILLGFSGLGFFAIRSMIS